MVGVWAYLGDNVAIRIFYYKDFSRIFRKYAPTVIIQ